MMTSSRITGETRQRSRIVGIAGGSASGKSTFAKALASAIIEQNPAATVEIKATDAYFTRDLANGPTFTVTTTGETMFDFNHPDAIDNDRLATDLRSMVDAEDAPDVIIVEGLMVLYVEEVRSLFDLKLFVELDADVRALRRMLRDMSGGRASKDPDFIASYYLGSARKGHARYVEPSRAFADLIIRGDADFDRIARLVSGCL